VSEIATSPIVSRVSAVIEGFSSPSAMEGINLEAAVGVKGVWIVVLPKTESAF
jgi:hypothetical protein